MVLYHSLNCRVALDLPFWILSATMIGKTFPASVIIRQILSFIATDSALLAQNVFLQIFVVAVLFCTFHVERYGARYHLMKAYFNFSPRLSANVK
jgi:hypothetical protein